MWHTTKCELEVVKYKIGRVSIKYLWLVCCKSNWRNWEGTGLKVDYIEMYRTQTCNKCGKVKFSDMKFHIVLKALSSL